MNKCSKDYNLIGYLRKQVPEDEKSIIANHLKTCVGCQNNLKEYQGVLELLGKIDVVEPSSNFEYRVMEQVSRITEPVETKAGFTNWIFENMRSAMRYSPPWLVSAAAHIILFAVLGLILIQPTQKQFQEKYAVKFSPSDYEAKLPVSSDTAGMTPVPPHSVWESCLPSLTQFDTDKEKKFLKHIATGRTPEKRKELLAKYGGDESTEQAVAQGIKWLKQTQEPDGSWNPEKSGGLKEYKIGLTALSLLTFLGDGNSSQTGSYSKTVKAGIKYLVSNQQSSGLFGPSQIDGKTINYMYNHGVATLAVIEDYVIGGDKKLEDVIRNAVNFMLMAQNSQGSWGYQAHNSTGDSMVTVWQIFSLRLARALDIPGVAESLRRSSYWLASITNEKGQVGYQRLNNWPNGYYATTAAGMFGQLFVGWDKENPLIRKQEKILSGYLTEMTSSDRKSDKDFYCWHFWSLAMIQKYGETWQVWNTNLKDILLKSQTAGSWAPQDRWAFYGGRLYTTSMAILTLQSYYRYAVIEG